MNKTLITADSSCYLPPELVPAEIPVIQAEIKTQNGRFRESYEIISENIIEYAKRERKTPELIFPTEEEYEGFFREQSEKADSVCHLCCAANLRTSYASARKAAAKFKNIFVADTKQVGGGMLFQIAQAARLASDGFSPEFIIKSINELDKHINSTYVTKSAYWMGYFNIIPVLLASTLDLMEISPTITVRSGTLISGAVLRNGRDYVEGYIKKMLKGKKNIDKKLLIVSCPKPFGKNIQKLREEIEKYARFEKTVFTDIPTRFACRLGEDSVGLHFLNI